MPSLRTAAEIEAEYDAARAAYLRALEAQSYSRSDSGHSRSVQRADLDVLRKHVHDLEREHAALARGGIKVRPMTPIDD